MKHPAPAPARPMTSALRCLTFFSAPFLSLVPKTASIPKALVWCGLLSLVCGIALAPLEAALLSGPFLLKKLTDPAKELPGVALERTVLGLDLNATPLKEVLYVSGGKVRSELEGAVRVLRPPYTATTARSEAPAASGAAAPGAAAPGADGEETVLRPLIFDAVLHSSAATLTELLKAHSVQVEQVSLARMPLMEGPLPYRVLFHLGGTAPDSSFIALDKDRFLLRRLQLRLPDGGLWLAEYDGHGQDKTLPAWLPRRTTLYRGGIRVETMSIERRLSVSLPDSLFKTPAPLPATPATPAKAP